MSFIYLYTLHSTLIVSYIFIHHDQLVLPFTLDNRMGADIMYQMIVSIKDSLKDKRNSIRDRYSFLKQWIRNPRQVGALCQTSGTFVSRIVDEIDWSGYVIELGPGLGNVTVGINDAINCKMLTTTDKFAAVEIDSVFCKNLRVRFPTLNITEGSASDLHNLFPNMIGKVSTIVSVLPMLSLPKELRTEISISMSKMLSPNGYVLQGTYGFKPSIPNNNQFTVSRLSTTWNNIPPISLDRYNPII